ncbi:MAG: ABC transporter permease [Odoribacter sp.]|nr:ABC transporter permease [Odoribacter sp.]
MRQFLAFVKKEFFHIFRDRRTVLILLVMPIVQIVLFGFALSSEVRNANLAIYDLSQDVTTEYLINRLDASEYFTVSEYLHSPAEIDEVFKEGRVDLVMVFEENFSDDLFYTGEASIQFIADATDPNYSTTLTNYATSIVADYQQELLEQYNIPFRINAEIKMLYNPQLKSAYNFVPGVMGLILILICAMMTSIAIVREKEMGSMEVLLASPLKPIIIIIAKAVPYFTLSVVNLITILLLSVYLLDVPIVGSLFWAFIISFIFILAALALGLLISTLVNNQVAAMMASGMGLMMPVMLLSGLMFPIESMPKILQWISAIIPARWYIEAMKKLMIQGVSIVYIYKELLILSVMAIILLFISLKKFKIRLE